jgi:hypothetical protein
MAYQPHKPSDFYFEVAKGDVEGHSSVNKFGHNHAAVAGDDVWGGGGKYGFYPTAGVLVDVVSTVDSDNGATATGALTLTVQGLDENWDLVEAEVTINGTTVVTSMTQTFVRLFRAFVRISGSSETNDGDITVYARATGDGVTAGDVGCFIEAGGGQTQQCIYTVPSGKSAYFIKGYVGLSTGEKFQEDGTFRWLLRVNAFGPGGAWLTQGEAGLTSLGTNYWIYEYGVPAGPIPEKTDIRIELTAASVAFDTVGGFDLVLVDIPGVDNVINGVDNVVNVLDNVVN